MRTALIILLTLCAAPVWSWELRPGDAVVDPATMPGRALTFYDDGVSRYSAGGSYSYTYSAANGGGTAYGTFAAQPDQSICITYRNGFARCDLLVENAGRLVLITEKGERYPVRPDPD